MHIPNSERLCFSLMTSQDADLLFKLDQNPEVMHFINGGKPTSMGDVHNIYVPRMESYTNAEKGWGLWKVCLQDSNEFLGWVLVRPMDFFTDQPNYNDLELGWRFMRSSWGKGYATEAANQIKQAFSNQPSVKALTAIAVEENTRSISIMKKLGMTFIKKAIHEDPLGDIEAVYYQLSLCQNNE